MENLIVSQFKDLEEKKSSDSLFICKEQTETETEERAQILIELTFFEREKISESENIAVSENRVDITKNVCCLIENVPLKTQQTKSKAQVLSTDMTGTIQATHSFNTVNCKYMDLDAVDCSSFA